MTTVLDGIYDILDAEATLINVYAYHGVANITLPALTVGPIATTPRADESMQCGAETIMPYNVTVGVRVHTSYSGGVQDQVGSVSLADDVVTELRQNIAAIDGCHILDVTTEFGLEFAESQTMGAQVTVTVLAHEHYIQE